MVIEEKLMCNQPKREPSTIQPSAGAACELKAVRWDSSNAVMCPFPAPSNQYKARRTLVYSVCRLFYNLWCPDHSMKHGKCYGIKAEEHGC